MTKIKKVAQVSIPLAQINSKVIYKNLIMLKNDLLLFIHKNLKVN